MIYEIEGDILLSDSQIIAHGVAQNDGFSSGLALSLREQWPAMFKDFRHYCQSERPEAGGLWVWGSADGKKIINLLTQEGGYDHGSKPGKATLSYVSHALRALKTEIESEHFTSVALPRLATGVGGLEWKDVSPLVEKHLGELKIPIYVYTTFRKGLKGQEIHS